MIHLERSPVQAVEVMRAITDSSTGIVVPSSDFVPRKLRDHPSLLLPFEVVSGDEQSLPSDVPMWGGVYSEEFAHSTMFVTDNIPEDVRPHAAALVALISSGAADHRLVRKMLMESSLHDQDIERSLGSTIVTAANYLEPMYCGSSRDERRDFRLTTGFDMDTHQHLTRAQIGEVVFSSDQHRQLYNKVIQNGFYRSERFNASPVG